MFKKGILLIVALSTLFLIINETILTKEEKPQVKFELADKTIPYKISNYSWGKALNKDKHSIKDTYNSVKGTRGTNAFKGEYVHIHFSDQPENVEILEHKTNNKSYIYDQYTNDYAGYAFQIDSQKGERIFEVKGIWKGNNYVTYFIKLKVS